MVVLVGDSWFKGCSLSSFFVFFSSYSSSYSVKAIASFFTRVFANIAIPSPLAISLPAPKESFLSIGGVDLYGGTKLSGQYAIVSFILKGYFSSLNSSSII